MSESKTTDHLDIYEGENYILITTTLSADLELVDEVDDYIKEGFTIASTSSGGSDMEVHMLKPQ